MKMRITFERLKSGQERPYADTVYRSRMLIETQGLAGYKDSNAPLVPMGEHVDGVARTPEGWPEIDPQYCIKYARVYSGWTDVDPNDHSMDAHFQTKLDYIKQVGPGLIEWQTTYPYDD